MPKERDLEVNVLRWNAAKVQQLTPIELWLFIVGRALAGFGVGILAMQYCRWFSRTSACP